MKSQNTCLTNLDNAHTDITNVLGELLKAEFGEKVSSITKVPGGINCEAFKVTTDKNKAYFAKKYNQRKGDSRNRLSTEFSGYAILLSYNRIFNFSGFKIKLPFNSNL